MAERANISTATVTPHHLLINRNAYLAGGIKPHYYCLRSQSVKATVRRCGRDER